MGDIFCTETVGILLGNEARVEVAGNKARMRQQSRLEWNVRADATNDECVQSFAHFGDGIVAVAAMHDELGDHRVVEHRNFTALLHAGVYTHTEKLLGVTLEHRGLGRMEAHQASRRWQEITERIFRVDAALNRPAIALHVFLLQGEWLTCCNTDHPLNQVQTRDALGHRMLHLQAGVHLEEIKTLVFADHKLNRASALVFHRLGQSHGLFAHGFAGGVADER